MNSPARYWHTLKYLKPVQLWYRLWFQFANPRFHQRPPQTVRSPTSEWKQCFRPASMLNRNTFSFLNRSRELEFPADWTAADMPALWNYNLHYFDDLVAHKSSERTEWHAALVAQWIADNPPTVGIGWDSYPTSLRIVNWAKWHLTGFPQQAGFLESLEQQARWLNRRIEYHLQANHLWANAKALLFAGVLFDGTEASGWRKTGERLIKQQLHIQVLNDAGQFERSPMYHAIVLEDLLDLLQLTDVFPGLVSPTLVTTFELKARAMLAWLEAMTHPDTKIALFNDAVLGIAPNLSSLTSYASAIGLVIETEPLEHLTHLPTSGYVRAQNTSMVLFCDVGDVGPDFQPGHGHADTLSCEASLFGERLLVNSGVDTYESGDKRLFQRSTAAHNTVEVDGENSSEVWGSFRVARRARPFGYAASQSAKYITVACSHDGYLRLSGKVVHNRLWKLQSDRLEIVDSLTGSFRSAVARFYLHPAIKVVDVSASGCHLIHRGQRVGFECFGGDLEVVASSYHPEFGKSLRNQCLLIRFNQAKCQSCFFWQIENAAVNPL